MHGYLLMYCVYNTLCISLNWWIHLYPLENKNSLKSQSHISLAVPEAHMIFFSCFVEEWRVKRREEKGREKKREITSKFFKFHFPRNLLLRSKINASLQNGIFKYAKLILPLCKFLYLICILCGALDPLFLQSFPCVFWITSSIAPPYCT